MPQETFAQAMRRERIRQITMLDDGSFSVVCIGYDTRGFGNTIREAIDECKKLTGARYEVAA